MSKKNKIRSLSFQMTETIDMVHKLHLDKHSLKRTKNKYDFVYSFNEKSNLCKISKQLAKFLKENFDVKYIKNVKKEHIESFLNSKSATCNNKSLYAYTSYIKKTLHLCNNRFKCNIDVNSINIPSSEKNPFKGELGDISRSKMMTEEHYYKIQSYLDKNESSSKISFRLSRLFGLRNSESVTITPQNVYSKGKIISNISKDKIEYLKVLGKGNKWRKIPIDNDKQILYLKKLLESRKNDNDRFVNIKADSVSARIRAAMKKISLTDQEKKDNPGCKTIGDLYKNTSQHAVRKLYATKSFIFLRDQKYLSNLEKGMDKEKAMENAKNYAYKAVLGRRLGHGNKKREALAKVYIDNFI
ncbi:MAG: integrase domain-containing protein [Firmicutes bacterium]|jgi:site-specific recombinase XerC|nr:integrase domain-containing protein [Bacillota bacterium]